MANPNGRDTKAVSKALAEPAVAASLDTLVERGCDREELLRLLARLRHADVAGRRETKTLKRLARTLEQASTGIADLPKWRESTSLGLPDDAGSWLRDCSHDLKLLADAIRIRLGQIDPQADDARIVRAKRRIVDQVVNQSGQLYEAEVTTLITAVLGREGSTRS